MRRRLRRRLYAELTQVLERAPKRRVLHVGLVRHAVARRGAADHGQLISAPANRCWLRRSLQVRLGRRDQRLDCRGFGIGHFSIDGLTEPWLVRLDLEKVIHPQSFGVSFQVKEMLSTSTLRLAGSSIQRNDTSQLPAQRSHRSCSSSQALFAWGSKNVRIASLGRDPWAYSMCSREANRCAQT